MMKRIMITILAISALQANVFAAGSKRTNDGAEKSVGGGAGLKADLLGTREELNAANGKLTQAKNQRCTRRNAAQIAAKIAALTQSIEDLQDKADALREQMHTAADAEQVRLNQELAINAANRAELEGQRSILALGDANGDNAYAVIYDTDGALVIDKDAYIQLQTARIEVDGLESMLTSARESEALLTAKIEAQSSGLVGQAIQAGGWTAWAGSLVQSVVDRFTGTKAALATTKESIVALEGTIIAKQPLLAVLKSAACPVAAACEPVTKAARHSGDAGV